MNNQYGNENGKSTSDCNSLNEASSRPCDADAPARPGKSWRRRSAKSFRGLPADEELAKLARTYIEITRDLWADAAKAGLLPEIDDDSISRMVADFKQRHTGVKPEALSDTLRAAFDRFGVSYSRYSCDNSDPHSIADQLVNELRKAAQEGRFIPWQYVYADYSVSGQTANRHGYQSVKRLLADTTHPIDTLYIDDWSRASREEIETWKLASLVNKLRKRLIGASDGFDLDRENSDVILSVYGIMARLFRKSLQQKVRRGMLGAVRRGTALGKPPLGYKLEPARDEQGNPRVKANGKPIHVYAIDPETAPFVREAFKLFAIEKWSCNRIAKHFNRLHVDGGDGWGTSTIRRVLRNIIYVGIEIWNRTRQECDPETGKVTVLENPRPEWQVRKSPHLRIIEDDLWKSTWRRLNTIRSRSKMTGRKLSRNQHSASTLFSGTLFCGYCGRELTLQKSGRYKVMACLRGVNGTQGCRLTSYKSTLIIENCLLAYIRDQLLTPEAVQKVVELGNEFLIEEASRPRVDLQPLRQRERSMAQRIRRLVQMVEGEEDEQLCRGYHERIKSNERELRELRDQLAVAEAQNLTPPAPITFENALPLLEDLRGTLSQSIPAAAEALREVTGPIRITQEPYEHKMRGSRWVAEFTPRLGAAMAKITRLQLCPDRASWEYLKRTIWTTVEGNGSETHQQPALRVFIGSPVPKYQQIAQQALEMAEKGIPQGEIGRQLGMCTDMIGSAIQYAKWGVPARSKPEDRPYAPRTWSITPIYIRLAKQVETMRDDQGKSLKQIGRELGVGEATAWRAYWRAKGIRVAKSTKLGERPPLSKYSHRLYRQYAEIQRLAAQGLKARQIAARTGLKIRAVFRELQSPHEVPPYLRMAGCSDVE